MAILPATGSAVSFGRAYKAYYNVAATAGTNVSLRATLGTKIGKSTGVHNMSSDFGQRTTPYNDV